jgi:hypothetical protein
MIRRCWDTAHRDSAMQLLPARYLSRTRNYQRMLPYGEEAGATSHASHTSAVTKLSMNRHRTMRCDVYLRASLKLQTLIHN